MKKVKVCTSNTFVRVDDVEIVLICDGVYRSADVYKRKDTLFARHGSGYISLKSGGSTSKPKIRWDEFCVTVNSEFEYGISPIGWLVPV